MNATQSFAVGCLAWLFTVAMGVAAEETRGLLEAVLATDYCGSAIEDGLSRGTALHGLSPVPGHGFVDLPVEEWKPVLLDMVAEEIDRCTIQGKELEAELSEALATRAEAAGTAVNARRRDELDKAVRSAEEARAQGTRRLKRMLALLQEADFQDEEAMLLLKRIAGECPRDGGLGQCASLAWIRLATRGGDPRRISEFADCLRERFGEDSAAEWEFWMLLAYPGLSWCETDDAKACVARLLLAEIEACEDYSRCRQFDGEAVGHLDGWTGSLQRRRLAERFRSEPPRGSFLEWNESRGQWERTPPTDKDIEEMLWSRAAAELAADESELVDLREVYGDWKVLGK